MPLLPRLAREYMERQVFFDGGERDFQFRGEFFIGHTKKRGIEKALLGAGKAEDRLLVYKHETVPR